MESEHPETEINILFYRAKLKKTLNRTEKAEKKKYKEVRKIA